MHIHITPNKAGTLGSVRAARDQEKDAKKGRFYAELDVSDLLAGSNKELTRSSSAGRVETMQNQEDMTCLVFHVVPRIDDPGLIFELNI